MPGVVSERKKPSIRNRVLWSRGLDYLNRTRPNDGTCPGIMPAAIRLVHCTMVSRQPRRERAKPRVGRFRKRLAAQRSEDRLVAKNRTTHVHLREPRTRATM